MKFTMFPKVRIMMMTTNSERVKANLEKLMREVLKCTGLKDNMDYWISVMDDVTLMETIDSFKENERISLKLRYGLNEENPYPMTYADIAPYIGLKSATMPREYCLYAERHLRHPRHLKDVFPTYECRF